MRDGRYGSRSRSLIIHCDLTSIRSTVTACTPLTSLSRRSRLKKSISTARGISFHVAVAPRTTIHLSRVRARKRQRGRAVSRRCVMRRSKVHYLASLPVAPFFFAVPRARRGVLGQILSNYYPPRERARTRSPCSYTRARTHHTAIGSVSRSLAEAAILD